MKKLLILITFLMPVTAMAQQTLEYTIPNTDLPNDLQQAKEICESHRHASNELLMSNPPQTSYHYDEGFDKICREVDNKIFSYNNQVEVKNKKDLDFIKKVVGN